MRFVGLTFKYFAKNFAYLLAACIFPSLIWGFSSNGNNLFTFLFQYHNIQIDGIGSIAGNIINFSIFKNFYPIFTFMVIGVGCASLLFSSIEYHLRVGKFTFRRPWSKMNASMLSVIFVAITLYAWLLLWAFILSCLLLLNHIIFSTIGSEPNFAAMISAYIIILLSCALLAESTLLTMFYIPTRLVLGYPFIDSLAFSIKLTEKKHGQLLLAVLIPIVVNFFASFILVLLPLKPSFAHLYQGAIFLFCAMYYISLSMTGWFELTGTERKDTKRIYYIK